MLVHIEGSLVEIGPLHTILDIGGLGYRVNVPLTTAEKLPKIGQIIRLHVSEIIREDQHDLYGFISKSERDFFELLIGRVSGIGPKIALNIMSRLSIATLRNAISSRDVDMLSQCHGIGKKTAERIIVELGDRVKGGHVDVRIGDTTAQPDAIQDAIHALISLGYKPADADKCVRNASAKIGESTSPEELIKYALKS
jgi:Holliday junction DNA helicase RuvA